MDFHVQTAYSLLFCDVSFINPVTWYLLYLFLKFLSFASNKYQDSEQKSFVMEKHPSYFI